jgi:heat shock protein beta
VTAVKVSNRLDVTPCVVVTGQYGNSANMERIQRYQVGGGGAACRALGRSRLCVLPAPRLRILPQTLAHPSTGTAGPPSAGEP